MIRTGLCASGGGGRGAFQIGVLEWLAEHPEHVPSGFWAVAGTSVGAINTLALASQRPGPDQIGGAVEYAARCWGRLETGSVWSYRFPRYFTALWSTSIGDNAPLRRLLREEVDFEAVRRGTPAVVGAWGLTSGRSRSWRLAETRSADHLVSVVLASSSFPGAFPPELVDGELYTDHGIVEIVPVKPLIGLGCDRIVAVVCRPPEVAPAPAPGNTFELLARCLDGMETEIATSDLREIELWNRLVEAGLAPEKRVIELVTVAPDEPLGDPLDFSGAETRRRRALGRSAARRAFGG